MAQNRSLQFDIWRKLPLLPCHRMPTVLLRRVNSAELDAPHQLTTPSLWVGVINNVTHLKSFINRTTWGAWLRLRMRRWLQFRLPGSGFAPRPFHSSRIGELVKYLSGMDKTLTYTLASHHNSLHGPNCVRNPFPTTSRSRMCGTS